MPDGASDPELRSRSEGRDLVEKAYPALAAISASLPIGVALLAGVLFYLSRRGSLPVLGSPFDLVAWGAAAILMLLVPGAPLLRRRLVTEQADSGEEAVQKYQTGVIVSMALIEGFGMLGVLAGFLAGSPALGVGLAVGAVLVMLLQWPRKEELRDRVRRAGG